MSQPFAFIRIGGRTSHDDGGGGMDSRNFDMDDDSMGIHDDGANHDILRHKNHRDGMAYLRQRVLPSPYQGLLTVVNRTFCSPLFSIFLISYVK